VSPRRAAQLVERIRTAPDTVLNEDGLPTLARANLLAAVLEAYSAAQGTAAVVPKLGEMARVAAKINSSDVLRDINEDRAVARFPAVTGEEAIAEHLAERTRYYRGVARAVLDGLPANDLVRVVTELVSVAASRDPSIVPPLIDELVDLYELEAQAFLTAEAENIDRLLVCIRESASAGEGVVEPLIDSLVDVARNWDMVAQPIQVGLRARGLEHALSRTVGVSIRSLAVDLFNQHEMLRQARRLTTLLRELFAELQEFAERLDGDAEALDNIEEERAGETQERVQWARDITYRAEIGIILKDVLSISPDGVAWRGKVYPLDTVARVRWGATRHSVNGVPTGTTYTIGFGDRQSTTTVETKREDVYDAFVDRLWKAVGVRLVLDTVRDLQDGREWHLSDVVIRDDGVTMFRDKFWSKERVHVPWRDIHCWSEAGSLHLASRAEAKIRASFSYIHVHNTHILARMLNAVQRRPGLTRLSEILG
jgi:hypothetical protein